MKMLICAFAASAIAGLAPQSATAADLGYYYEGEDRYVERPVIERERIVETRRYYEPYDYDYLDEPIVTYRRGYRPYPYYAAAYPYRYGRYHHRGWHRGRW